MAKRKMVPPNKRVKVMPLKKVQVEIAGSVVNDLIARVEKMEARRPYSTTAVGFTYWPEEWDDDGS